MNVWNTAVYMIFIMSIYQLSYDVTFGMTSETYKSSVYYGGIIFSMIGGIGATIVSNIMICKILFIVSESSVFCNGRWLNFFTLFASLIPSIIIAAFYIQGITNNSDDELNDSRTAYDYIRLISIAMNVIGAILMYLIVRNLMKLTETPQNPSAYEKSMIELVRRIMYYPLIQVISRFFVSWYSIQYGNNKNPGNTASTLKLIIQVLGAILPNVGSVLYFCVFLKMQPRAYSHFLHRIKKCERYMPDLNEESKNNGIAEFRLRETAHIFQSRETSDSFNNQNMSFFQWIRQSNFQDVDDDDLINFYDTNKPSSRISILGNASTFNSFPSILGMERFTFFPRSSDARTEPANSITSTGRGSAASMSGEDFRDSHLEISSVTSLDKFSSAEIQGAGSVKGKIQEHLDHGNIESVVGRHIPL